MAEPEQGIQLICSTSKYSADKVLSRMKDKKFKWIYLGEDMIRTTELEGKINGKGERIKIAQLLQETARGLRQKYVNYIGRFSIQNNSLDWWAGRLHEKNPFVSKAFLNICYLKTIMEIFRTYKNENLVIFAENRKIREAIKKNSPQKKIEVIEAPWEFIMESIGRLKKVVIYKMGFLLYNIYRIMISKYVYRMQKQLDLGKPLVLVNTFINPGSFDENGKYHESYFGRLYPYLKKQGKNTAITPQIFRTVSYRKTIEKMKKSEYKFLVPHSFLSFSDVFRVFFRTFPWMHKKMSFPRFADMEVHEIIADDIKKDCMDNHVAFGLLFYHLIKRLRKNNVPIERILYTYENHAWEKVLCIAVREYYPSVSLIAYQHAVFSMMSLSYFFSKEEYGIMPKPDRIITNGKYSRDVLIRSGYPSEKLVQGGAIKYIDTMQIRFEKKNKNGKKPVILVTPTLGKTSIELIEQVFMAFRNSGKYDVIIRCHPTLPFESISRDMNFEFPKHITIAEKPFSELLKESDVLIYTSSATCVEAGAAGIPAIHVQSELSIDLDPFDCCPKARISTGSSEELIKGVEKVLNVSKEEAEKRENEMKKLLAEFFGKIDDSVYELFLNAYKKD